MKKLLILSLLFCSAFCEGQHISVYNEDGSIDAALSSPIEMWSIYVRPAPGPEKDTVKVIMLICDTLNKGSAPYEVAWRYGYNVREHYKDQDCGTCRPIWQNLFYLDEWKQPIRKGIVVWQSKEIN